MKIGDKIQVVKCDVCPKVVGKVGTVTKVNLEVSSINVKFGKGRPQLNRPSVFAIADVVILDDEPQSEDVINESHHVCVE